MIFVNSQTNFKLKYKIQTKIISKIKKLSNSEMVKLIQSNDKLIRKILKAQVPDVHRFNLTVSGLSNPTTKGTKQTSKKTYLFEKISDKKLSKFKKSENENVIVLLLESPHKDEFDYKYFSTDGENTEITKMTPMAPARGSTGTAIDHHLLTVLMPIIKKDGEYKIFIVNPIQYQTSLWAIHGKPLAKKRKKTEEGKLRDEVWKALWDFKDSNAFIFQDDFRNRLNSYSPEIIINCCTKEFRQTVTDYIKTTKNNSKNNHLISLDYLYGGSHPSSCSWNSHNSRKLTNIKLN
jgi:hypothetical protein